MTYYKKGTIGHDAHRKAKEYFDLYLSFRQEPQFRNKARTLAVHDLVVTKVRSEMAYEELVKKIEKHEKKEKLKKVA